MSYILTMTPLCLSIQLMPDASRCATLANLMPRQRWYQLRRSVYRKAHYRCQICGSAGRMYCHEVWYFNEQTSYQHLMGFKCLCEACHKMKHIFFVRDSQQRAILFQHFLTVNRMTREQGLEHLQEVYRQQQRLNQKEWTVNYGVYNCQIPSTANVQQRRSYARFNHPRYR